MNVQECVQNGIDFLNNDNRIPEDWYDYIDLDILDMSSLETCVLGQIRHMIGYRFGRFDWDLGFESEAMAESVCEIIADQEYAELKIEWTKRIKEMRA